MPERYRTWLDGILYPTCPMKLEKKAKVDGCDNETESETRKSCETTDNGCPVKTKRESDKKID